MFYGLSGRARRAITKDAQSFARTTHTLYLHPEHILHALMAIEEGLGAIALRRSGVDLETMGREINRALPSGRRRRSVGDLPPSARAKALLERASAEASRRGHDCIGTIHLLVAYVGESDSPLRSFFDAHGVTVERLLDALGGDTAVRWESDGLE